MPPPPTGYATTLAGPTFEVLTQDEPTEPSGQVAVVAPPSGDLTYPPRLIGSTPPRDKDNLQAPPITPDFFTRSGHHRR